MPFVAAALVAASVTWFHSPSGNIQCELAAGYAYCQTFQPAEHVTLSPRGRLTTCRGVTCLGNGPEGARTLAYGRSIRVGPFRCTSLATGVRCVAGGGAHGFLISRAGIRRV